MCQEALNKHSVEMICEFAAVEISSINLLVLAVYRPPGGDFDAFLSNMCTILEILTDCSRYVVVTGDFNINFNLNSTRKQNFMDLINSWPYVIVFLQYKTNCMP